MKIIRIVICSTLIGLLLPITSLPAAEPMQRSYMADFFRKLSQQPRLRVIALAGIACLGLCAARYYQTHHHIDYRRATLPDVPGVLDLMNTQAVHDSNKIVIVPERFRKQYLEGAVSSGSLFVASQGKNIVGYKKLFCINPANRDETINDELRLNTTPVAQATVSLPDLQASPQPLVAPSPTSTTYVYTGADFTHPQYRSKGINSNLTKHALTAVTKEAIEQCRRQKIAHIAMVYGLTQENAGVENNLLDGRTRGIVQQFMPFARRIADACGSTQPTSMLLSRHAAFKPSFDPQATECRPLPDRSSIPGYGCMIACPLPQRTAELS